jgi:DNA-directed RNA polymerase beta' subunit
MVEVEKQIELLKLQIELINIQKELSENELAVPKWKTKENAEAIREAQKNARDKWASKNPDYWKIYQARNRDKIIEYRRTNQLVKEKCPICEKEITKVNLKRHINAQHDGMEYVGDILAQIEGIKELID